jgi:hypothetical protein
MCKVYTWVNEINGCKVLCIVVKCENVRRCNTFKGKDENKLRTRACKWLEKFI